MHRETGHAEVADIVYDPAAITLPELLEVFWQTHDPTTLGTVRAPMWAQYRSAIFYRNADRPMSTTRPNWTRVPIGPSLRDRTAGQILRCGELPPGLLCQQPGPRLLPDEGQTSPQRGVRQQSREAGPGTYFGGAPTAPPPKGLRRIIPAHRA